MKSIQATGNWFPILLLLWGVRFESSYAQDYSHLKGYASKPNDEWYDSLRVFEGIRTQWYLENRDFSDKKAGMDLNIRSAWPISTGAGIVVAVVDSGVQFDHPDLMVPVQNSFHYSFVNQTTNGLPKSGDALGAGTGEQNFWAHGTSVAGLVAATAYNETGMTGVAPDAQIASWVVHDPSYMLASEQSLAQMFQLFSNSVQIQNHSWKRGTSNLISPSEIEKTAISNAIESGREGKGVIIVRSAGNNRSLGQNVNDDAYVNDPRVIAVAAVKENGRAIDASNPGASLLIAAPAQSNSGRGLFTTDLQGADGANSFVCCVFDDDNNIVFTDLLDYRGANGFSGTSASAPLISGIAALVLSANPGLTYRDVQQVLIQSSRHYDLEDPDVKENGAGFLFSHNVGFGIPDAGFAVRLAENWSNRPEPVQSVYTISKQLSIPDDGLRLEVSGSDVPVELESVRTSFALGAFPDEPTSALPLADVGLADEPIALDLTGKAALIERGEVDYIVKLHNAADAGAEFAVIYNREEHTENTCPGGDFLCPIGGSEFSPIPAVSIGRSNGLALIALLENGSEISARIKMETTDYVFNITETLITEHVGVRVKTGHPLRGDLRITLLSPSGTRSVLQRFNQDIQPGPEDWTYYSTRHFYESSFGEWKLSFSDLLAENSGDVLEVSLIISGVPIEDSDTDGLDDSWEMANLGSSDFGPKDDPDTDGYINSREQIIGTDPLVTPPLELFLSALNATKVRIAWPGKAGEIYEVWSGASVDDLQLQATVSGEFPETEWVASSIDRTQTFFQIRK